MAEEETWVRNGKTTQGQFMRRSKQTCHTNKRIKSKSYLQSTFSVIHCRTKNISVACSTGPKHMMYSVPLRCKNVVQPCVVCPHAQEV